MANFVPITWGRLRLWCARVETDNSRNLIVHDLTQGDEHPVHDGGLVAHRVRCELLFDDFPGETDPPKVRLERMRAAVNIGAEAMFTHPIEGAFMAKVGRFEYRFDEDSNITASAEFVPADGATPVSPAGAGVPGVAGEASVDAAADALDFELESVYDDATLELLFGLEDSPKVTTQLARDAVATWGEGETVPTRQIITDTADISNRLAAMIDTLALEDDLAVFGIYKATILLGDAVRAAAIAATSETPAVFTMRVTTPIVLLRLMAQIYGGAEAEDRERQVRELNDIRTPGWFGPGELLLPVKGSSLAA